MYNDEDHSQDIYTSTCTHSHTHTHTHTHILTHTHTHTHTHLMFVVVFPLLCAVNAGSMLQILIEFPVLFFRQELLVFLLPTFMCSLRSESKGNWTRMSVAEQCYGRDCHQGCKKKRQINRKRRKHNNTPLRSHALIVDDMTFLRTFTHKFLQLEVIIVVDRRWGC